MSLYVLKPSCGSSRWTCSARFDRCSWLFPVRPLESCSCGSGGTSFHKTLQKIKVVFFHKNILRGLDIYIEFPLSECRKCRFHFNFRLKRQIHLWCFHVLLHPAFPPGWWRVWVLTAALSVLCSIPAAQNSSWLHESCRRRARTSGRLLHRRPETGHDGPVTDWVDKQEPMCMLPVQCVTVFKI